MNVSEDRIYSFSVEEKKRCFDFAEEVYSTNKNEYSRRGQDNKSAILFQIATGKIAEIAVSEQLSLPYPDFEIYPASKKSYMPDLQDGWYCYHVKSIEKSSAERYGMSWLFQKNDPLVKNPEWNDILVFTFVDFYDNIVKIVDITTPEKVMWGKPKKEGLQKTKVAVYYEQKDLP